MNQDINCLINRLMGQKTKQNQKSPTWVFCRTKGITLGITVFHAKLSERATAPATSRPVWKYNATNS